MVKLKKSAIEAGEAYLGIEPAPGASLEVRAGRVREVIRTKFNDPDWGPNDPRWRDADAVDDAPVERAACHQCGEEIPYDANIETCFFDGAMIGWSEVDLERRQRSEGWGRRGGAVLPRHDEGKKKGDNQMTQTTKTATKKGDGKPGRKMIPAPAQQEIGPVAVAALPQEVTDLATAEKLILEREKVGSIMSYQLGVLYSKVKTQNLADHEYGNFWAWVDDRMKRDHSYVRQLMAMVDAFDSEEEVKEIGAGKAREIAQLPSATDRKKLTEKAKKGATRKEIQSAVKEIRRKAREKSGTTPTTKAGRPRVGVKFAELYETKWTCEPGEPTYFFDGIDMIAKIDKRSGKVAITFEPHEDDEDE